MTKLQLLQSLEEITENIKILAHMFAIKYSEVGGPRISEVIKGNMFLTR